MTDPFRTLLLSLLLTSLLACRQEQASRQVTGSGHQRKEHSAWLQSLIRKQQEQQVADPPAKIYRYRYRGRAVYYLTSRCCDQPGRLYDSRGQLLCEPDGGITGQGDGRCPDFFGNRTDETLIWEDKR